MRLRDYLARFSGMISRFVPPRNSSKSILLGRRGERAATRFLKRRGYRILALGDRSSRRGELDIVAADGKTVVFVEVKTRTTQATGHPSEAVNADKQRRLTKLAVAFLKRHRLLDAPSRFDIIAITWPPAARKPQIEHIRNAFEAVGYREFFS